MRTKVVSFFIFSRAFKQKKIKALRPKMTKIASRGGGGPALMDLLIEDEEALELLSQERSEENESED